jgi:hypothetical protein
MYILNFKSHFYEIVNYFVKVSVFGFEQFHKTIYLLCLKIQIIIQQIVQNII